jgi:hypothetical protein
MSKKERTINSVSMRKNNFNPTIRGFMILSLGIEIRSILNEKLNNFQLKFKKKNVKSTLFL